MSETSIPDDQIVSARWRAESAAWEAKMRDERALAAAELARLRAELAEAQRERDGFREECQRRRFDLLDAERDRDAAKAEAERLREALEDFANANFEIIRHNTRDPQDELDPVTDYETVAAHQDDARAALHAGRDAAKAEAERLREEVADLKSWVIAFGAPWAAKYGEDYFGPGLMHPEHYDILERCGARMASFARAALQEKRHD